MSKTQIFDYMVLIDHPAWWGAALGAHAAGKGGDSPLFSGRPEDRVRDWKEAEQILGVPRRGQCQLRHRGASSDLVSRRRSLGGVMTRSRRQTFKSLRRNTKPGPVAQALNKFSVALRDFLRTSHLDIEGITHGQISAALP